MIDKTFVAIKILNDNLEEEHMDYYKIEIEMLSKINHLNVIRILDNGYSKYTNKNGKERMVYFVVLEKA